MAAQMKEFLGTSYLFGGNAPFIEELYEAWLEQPDSVAPEWQRWFEQIQQPGTRDVAHTPVREAFIRLAYQRPGGNGHAPTAAVASVERKQVSVLQLINAYRFLGLRHANVDPLKRFPKPEVPELDPAYYGLTEADMNSVFNTGSLVGPEQLPLREILRAVRETYCGSIGVEYMYISDVAQKRWVQSRFEGVRSAPSYSPDYKRHILERVTAAETLEKYLHTRYVGQKRFSLEGGESLIPLLDNLLQRAGEKGIRRR
jgi:2-oxoglutarate dehydrogenase E1 component